MSEIRSGLGVGGMLGFEWANGVAVGAGDGGDEWESGVEVWVVSGGRGGKRILGVASPVLGSDDGLKKFEGGEFALECIRVG